MEEKENKPEDDKDRGDKTKEEKENPQGGPSTKQPERPRSHQDWPGSPARKPGM